jgi:hypothetical protein
MLSFLKLRNASVFRCQKGRISLFKFTKFTHEMFSHLCRQCTLHIRAGHRKKRKEHENNTSHARRPTYNHINIRSQEKSHKKKKNAH